MANLGGKPALSVTKGTDLSESEIFDRFMEYVSSQGLSLYPAQEEAILELFAGSNVILNTPTGSGKSLVAAALHFHALAKRRRSVYTCPIKALVNEKFLALCRDFGPENVGMITGDATVNPDAPILCCTAEILAQFAMRSGSETGIHDVIMDEFHYYSDRDRGVAWQIPLLTMTTTRFLLMSATLGDTEFFEKELTELNGFKTLLVQSAQRPVPLDFQFSEDPLHEAIAKVLKTGRAPVYIVNFTQRECAEVAQSLLSTDFCTKEEKRAILEALTGFVFSSPFGKEIAKLIKHGIGIHHAGLLPKYRVLVEKLAQRGLLKIICGTDTLGVGVNVPIRTVLFTKLCKFDGQKTTLLSVRDFKQIAGRAGRKGFDDLGTVIAQAPEHVIENLRMESKAAADPKRAKKFVKRKPPEKGYIPWTKETFQKLIDGKPEALQSRFSVNHAMVLLVLSRGASGVEALRSIIRRAHETPEQKRRHGKNAWQLFRSLHDRKIIELNPLRIHVDLQEDFSLNHGLALYLLDTLTVMDPMSATYGADVLTLAESILENPEQVLRKQVDALKTEKMAEMKMAGMEYDERMEELEKIEYPKPNAEFIYQTFNHFAQAHPWLDPREAIRPKSIAREMFETYQSFHEYIRNYDLHRSEGTLLRYLSDVFKVLTQTIPPQFLNDELESMITFFGSMVRGVDSSLIDEWERMKSPNFASPLRDSGSGTNEDMSSDITRDQKKFTLQVRNAIFEFVRALSIGDYERASGFFPRDCAGGVWTAADLENLMNPYRAEHGRIRTDSPARGAEHFHRRAEHFSADWEIEQVLVDVEGKNDWVAEFGLDFQRSRIEQRPFLILNTVRPV